MPPSVEMMSASVAYRCVDLVLSSTFDVSLVVLAESDVPRYVKKLRATPYPVDEATTHVAVVLAF